MKIPLEKKLRKKLHIEIGYLQDEVVELLYSISNELVLHGGTAIWRCYGGNRFSEDLDLYGQLNKQALNKKIKERNLTINKMKNTENLTFMKISNGRVEIRVEINKKVINEKSISSYERMDGNFLDIYTLSIENIINEKINAYNSRRFIRDLYDIYHLSRTYELSDTIKIKIKEFLKNIKPPIDETILKSLIYTGIAPTFNSMISYLRSI